jgi:pimeloyl-ACP methyl ester carboxylesterase
VIGVCTRVAGPALRHRRGLLGESRICGVVVQGSGQGGLQGYRIGTDPRFSGQLKAFSERTIDVPAMFIAGAKDWGTHQAPGALERMAGEICTRYRGTHLVEGAGHWVQQERPDEVNALLEDFLRAA